MTILEHPIWLADDLAHLAVRRGERVLVVTAPPDAHVAALCRAVGPAGRVLVVEPDRGRAVRLSGGDPAALEVVSTALVGGERFGTFDAMWAAPLTRDGWSTELWAGLARQNLRPGARFVCDLPAPDLCPDLAASWRDAGLPLSGLAPLSGPDEQALALALRAAALRDVQPSGALHLVRLDHPGALAQLAEELLPGVAAHRRELEQALVRHFGTTAAVDVIFRRSVAYGRR